MTAREAELDATWQRLEQEALERVEFETSRQLVEIAEHERVVARRETELMDREIELRDLARAEPPPAAPERVSEPQPEPVEIVARDEGEAAERPSIALVPDLPEAEVQEAGEAVIQVDGRWNLDALAALVEARAGEFPQRVEEWRAYIVYLRDFVGPDSLLPAAFDGLVVDVFGSLVETPQRA